MKIVPDYKHKEIKCYYCNKNIADETCGNTQELICISQPHLASYDYVYVKVEVPRCKECSKKTLNCISAVFSLHFNNISHSNHQSYHSTMEWSFGMGDVVIFLINDILKLFGWCHCRFYP